MTILTIKTNTGFNTTWEFALTNPKTITKNSTSTNWVVQDTVTGEKQIWTGTGFTYDAAGNISGGQATKVVAYDANGKAETVTTFTTAWDFAQQGYPTTYTALLTGDDVINGGDGNDVLSGGQGISGAGTYFYNGHTYLLSNAGTWTDAEAQAVSLGGHLVTINDQAENDWIMAAFANISNLWIGYTDQEVEGAFKWISGENSNYSNWNSGEPNDYWAVGGEDYAHIMLSYYGLWNDLPNSLAGYTPMQGLIEINNTSTGEDTFKGGLGNDTYFVDSVGDKVVEFAGEGDEDEILSAVSYKLPDNVEFLTLQNTDASSGFSQSTPFNKATNILLNLMLGTGWSKKFMVGIGNAQDNVITGNNANNVLLGNDGMDMLDAQDGNDILAGGIGDDDLLGGNGTDTAFYGSVSSGYKVEYSKDFFKVTDIDFSDGNDGVDTLASIEKIRFSDTTIDTQAFLQAGNNQLIHTGALFAILSYGEASLWADQDVTTDGWETYSGVADEGFDDNYKDFFADTNSLDEKWTLLTNEQLGDFGTNDAHATFTDGGLYHGYISVEGWILDDSVTTQSTEINGVLYGDSNAVVATNGDTLVLAFRGTDNQDTAGLGGQAWTGDGQYLHYEAFRPLIEKVLAYAQDSTHGINHVVVSGHSLGGAMADTFTAVDAHRFVEAGLDLNVVSLASAGLDGDAFNDGAASFLLTYDHSILPSFSILGSPQLVNPSFYTGFAHNKDRVFHWENDESDVNLTPNGTLTNNGHFATKNINLPNISNTDVNYHTDWFDLEFDNGFGAHHNGLIYYKNLDALYDSKLLTYYQGQKLIFGVGNYVDGSTWFEGNTGFDFGALKLNGTDKSDFIFGLEGDDTLNGKAGNDLLDGGDRPDTLIGGAGSDKMAGGLGNDVFVFNFESESTVGNKRDVIVDFGIGIDKIDVSGIDAADGNPFIESFTFKNSDLFNDVGQLRFSNGILSGNTAGDLQPEFEIALLGVTELSDYNLSL